MMINKKRLLLFMPYIPYPVDRGTYQRVYHLFLELAKKFEIDLVCLQEDATRTMDVFEPYTRRRLAIPFKHPPWQKLFPHRLLNPVPATVEHWNDRRVMQAFRSFVAGEDYDVVDFIDIVLWPYIREVFPTHPRRVMDRSRVDWLFQSEELKTLDLSFRERMLRRENLFKLKRMEREVYASLAGMVVCGLDDETFLKSQLGETAKVFVLANGFKESYFDHTAYPRKRTESPTILFCGALDYSPNVDAINWFGTEIWPLIRRERPEVVWRIIGKSPDGRVEKWRGTPGVDFVGEVPDVRPYYQTSWLQVVPLRIGGGTRLKIVESLGMKTPVVSTVLGAQGLALEDGKHLLLADEPEAFSQAVLRLIEDDGLRQEIEAAGLIQVMEHYRWNQLGDKLIQFLEGL